MTHTFPVDQVYLSAVVVFVVIVATIDDVCWKVFVLLWVTCCGWSVFANLSVPIFWLVTLEFGFLVFGCNMAFVFSE
jgi:hypothetical protein